MHKPIIYGKTLKAPEVLSLPFEIILEKKPSKQNSGLLLVFSQMSDSNPHYGRI
jgi:hypothetical protein